MSDVNANNTALINGHQDVAHLYSGSGPQAKAGIETEMAFLNPKAPDLDVMSLAQNRVLKNAAMNALGGDWVHNEPTSELLEVSTLAADPKNLQKVLEDANKKIKILTDKALGLGLKRSYFQELPERTADDLLSRIVDVARYNIMYNPYRADMKKCVQYFAVCKSNQVSVSYKNQNHGHQNVRRLYALAPFLFMLTDNSTGFSEGKPLSGHAGMTLRHNGLLEGRGGVMPYAISAQSGESFFAKHIDHVLNNPLFMYYDLDGNLKRIPSGEWVTFNQLKERGLNTASNYYLAQSLIWPDVKIAALKDDNGDVYGHRYEARMFGVGLHQHQTALIATSALAFDDDFAAHVDELLERYGFDWSTPEATLDLIRASYEAARNHNGKFMNVAFGNGNMLEFARSFADLIEPATENLNLWDETQPLLDICRTGCTDGKVNRALFPTLPDIKNFQRSYHPDLFDNPNQSARMALQKELKNNSHNKISCCG